jgi:ABC-type lipoprotein export system ATPase subunit
MLVLENVSKSYAPPEGGESVPVLRNISLTLKAGRSLAVVGPSGSGKSTLLNLMGGLDHPTEGRVLLDGRDLSTLNNDGLAGLRSRAVGFVFQLHHLLPQCTALENVLVPTLAGSGGEPRSALEKRAGTLLARVGLEKQMHRRPGALSGGERQRVAVARALINRPSVLLADEPTGALDGETARRILELLLDVNRTEGVALVCVTHAMEIAAPLERIGELRGGVLRERGGETA